MKLLSIIFLVSIFIGCQKKQTETDKPIPVYKVDLDKTKEISVYNIFSKVDVIPLRTPDSIVCTGIKSYVYKDNVFFLDWRQKIVLCFDLNGNYRYQINSKGRGPKEYSDILGIFIDHYNDYLTILDRASILQFDLSGNFVKKIRNPENLVVHAAKMINRDTMVCLTVTNNNNERKIVNYLSLKESKIIASCYSEHPIFPVAGDFFEYNDKVYYNIRKTSVIYSMNDLKLTPEYKWDFGKYNYDYEDLSLPQFEQKKDVIKIQLSWLYKNCSWLTGIIAENTNCIYIRISFFKNVNGLKEKTPEYHIFWNKKTEAYNIAPQFKEGEVFHVFSSWTEDAVYCAVERSQITNYIQLEALTPENRKIVEELLEDANPVLLKYSFK